MQRRTRKTVDEMPVAYDTGSITAALNEGHDAEFLRDLRLSYACAVFMNYNAAQMGDAGLTEGRGDLTFGEGSLGPVCQVPEAKARSEF